MYGVMTTMTIRGDVRTTLIPVTHHAVRYMAWYGFLVCVGVSR